MGQKITLNGQQVGKLRGSFLLLKETFRFLRSDMEMLWVPIIAFVLEMFLIGAFVFALLAFDLVQFVEEGTETSPAGMAVIFIGYVIGAFVVAWSQAIITHIVATRAHNGDATLGEGLSVANSHFGALLLWSMITSTVGILLRAIAERSQIGVKIVTAVLGAAWSILTYFVVPSIILGKQSGFGAISESGKVFKRTWGETAVTNISLGLIFVLFFIGYLIVLFGIVIVFMDFWPIALVLGVIGLVVLSIVSSVLGSVLRTLLYMYASEGTVPENFNAELLGQIMARKDGLPNTPQVGVGETENTNTSVPNTENQHTSMKNVGVKEENN